ncbi:hypothetical protein L6307_00655 [Candidatus Parcubacteria bacterium]|nr:hypothetical protein [Candidatus Parcubacteria bacterium]
MGKLEVFKRNRCILALIKLGFTRKKTRRGMHDKYVPPQKYLEIKIENQPPFIMIPRSRNLHCQPEIVKELRNLGGDELVKKFEEYL